MTVSPGYFEVFKIPVKRGRTFNERDTSTSTPVVVINEAMAKQFWPKADPLNDRLLIGKGVMREFAAEGERQIIGIVGRHQERRARQRAAAADVHPAGAGAGCGERAQRRPDAAFLDRADAGAVTVAEQRDPGPAASVDRPARVGRAVDGRDRALSVSRQKFNMWVMTVFGGCALLLAAIGIYGLMAYSVEQRTQEIGIRLALGAQASQVRNMVVGQGMALALAGIAIGLAAAFWLARLITSFLFGVTATDPLVFAGVPVLLTVVALLAVWLPARRASRVDPIIALRYE